MKTEHSKKQWMEFLTKLIDGIEAHLPASAPAIARKRLAHFKLQLRKINTSKARKQLEREFDSFAESTPYMRKAVDRYLAPQIKKAVTEANRALKLADTVIRQCSDHKVRQKKCRTCACS